MKSKIWIFVFLAMFLTQGNAEVRKTPSSGLTGEGGFLWGVCGHPLGGAGIYREQDGVQLHEQMALIRELGCNWYRADIFCRDPNDELDLIAPAARKAGVELYPTLHPPEELRPYDTLAERMKPDKVYQLCYDHAKKAAEKWRGKIKVWDLANEPDGWVVNPSVAVHGDKPEHYVPERIEVCAAMLKGQADGLKAGDPSALVSLNTGGWLHYAFVDLMIQRGVGFDILSWHWYSDMGWMDNVEKMGGFNVLAKLKTYGKPIWIGECNYRPNVSIVSKGRDDPQADEWLLSTLRRLHRYRREGVEAVFIYQLLDQPTLGENNPESYYGLVKIQTVTDPKTKEPRYIQGKRKPLFEKVRSLIQTLSREK
ncbi:MAG: hypothetical protein JXA11_11665 [Phycisphaerae bacterium]|nr:hypothetical protein [Phycisphaerae bacterium]